MSVKKILELHKKFFNEKLKQKTSWGRNEISLIFEQSKSDALTHYIDSGVEECQKTN